VGSVCARLRFCEPVPHDLVHVDQAPKPSVTQSVAHAAVLHARVSAECGHATPPSVGSTVARLRHCEPVPHDLVHVDQASKAGHALPPLSGRRDTTRTRPCSPPPHEAEQRLHWPQLDVAQSVLQACGLQKVCCLSDGQLPKVFLGEVTTRVRVFVPTPQRREHADQVLQTEMAQSMAPS